MCVYVCVCVCVCVCVVRVRVYMCMCASIWTPHSCQGINLSNDANVTL